MCAATQRVVEAVRGLPGAHEGFLHGLFGEPAIAERTEREAVQLRPVRGVDRPHPSSLASTGRASTIIGGYGGRVSNGSSNPWAAASVLDDVRTRLSIVQGVLMRHIHIRALATVAVAALALAALREQQQGGELAPTTSAPRHDDVAPTTTTVAAAAPRSVTLATTKLGKILVDAKGMTLYQFDNDKTPSKSTCGAGQCAIDVAGGER